MGGFGSSVAEWLARENHPLAELDCLGVPDILFHETLDQETARERCGLTPTAASERIARRFKTLSKEQACR